jgi:hypothetical protein
MPATSRGHNPTSVVEGLMRITGVIVLLLIVGAIGFGAYYFMTHRESVMEVVKKGQQQVQGYTPAKTPDEAVDKFRSAVKARDYDAAAVYCTTDYADQPKRASTAANALATAIDNMLSMMDTENIKSDRVTAVLKLLEPFPRDVKVVGGVQKQGDDKATVTLQEDFGNLKVPDLKAERWSVDLSVFRALAGGPAGNFARGLPVEVNLVRVKQGDETAWKLDIPVTPEMKTQVDELRDKYKNYVKALEKLTTEIRAEPTTKADLEAALKRELEQAK